MAKTRKRDGKKPPARKRPSIGKLFTVTAVVLLVASALHLWRSRFPSSSTQDVPPGLLHGFNLLLVTMDTLRADVLGAYGSPDGLTPNLDRLAAEGIRFTSAFAQASMTLPSHCSILTGTHPMRHGVRDNGMFRLEASQLTLAEILKQAGYRTGAFVGAFVLDARFGLSQGYDLYDDYYGEKTTSQNFNFVERRAENVLSPATAWIMRDDGRPWFAWVHLFDPHIPYDPPEPYRERYGDRPYAGEVAYTDHALGAALDRLRSAGGLRNTLVVLTADHGESLGEHGEETHGAFAYNATLQVPLIVWADRLEPRIVSETVSHIDVVPTVLDLLGLSIPESVQGNTLLPCLGGRPTARSRPVYFETLHPYLTQNLAPLTGIIEGEYKFIDLPVPELYRISNDPHEKTNLYADERVRAAELRDDLEELVGTVTRESEGDVNVALLDEETRERLRALGYIVSASPPTKTVFTAADDPKNAIGFIETERTAMSLHGSGRSDEAVALLRGLIEDREDFTSAYTSLAFILLGKGRFSEAIGVLEKAADLNPDNRWVRESLGTCYSEAGQPAKAVPILETVIEQDPHNVDALSSLGVANAQLGRRDEALALFERVLELDPSSAQTYNNIGTLYLRERRFPDAVQQFRRVIDLEPGFWAAYEGLGTALAATGQLSEAVEAWKRLLELHPAAYDGLYNIGVALVELGRDEEALPYLEEFLREAPPERYGDDIRQLKRLSADVRKRLR